MHNRPYLWNALKFMKMKGYLNNRVSIKLFTVSRGYVVLWSSRSKEGRHLGKQLNHCLKHSHAILECLVQVLAISFSIHLPANAQLRKQPVMTQVLESQLFTWHRTGCCKQLASELVVGRSQLVCMYLPVCLSLSVSKLFKYNENHFLNLEVNRTSVYSYAFMLLEVF